MPPEGDRPRKAGAVRASYPRGRRVPPGARAAIAELLGSELPAAGRPARDRLIEHLHRIQDRYGVLSADHLAALAEAHRLAETEVFEVATFYHHFDVGHDAAPPPPLRVCDGLPCRMAGAEEVLARLTASADPAAVRVVAAPCMGACDQAPVVWRGPDQWFGAEAAHALACRPDVAARAPTLAEDQAAGGFAILEKCRNGAWAPADVIGMLGESGLRGMGGAGFPTGRKWGIVASQPGPRLMAVNADEGEPGTIKDRWLLETGPLRVLEGVLIAAWAVGIERVWIYVRDEYPEARARMAAALEAVRGAGLLGSVEIELRRGAGAYICGEESAMLESIEGKRGLPRHRPPFVAERGLFDRPTLVNNVETLWWLRDILANGPAWFANQGRRGAKGSRAFSLSGRVRLPGVKIAPNGITVSELIAEFGGGMAEGHNFAAYLPGGASGGILPAALGDLPLDFGTLEPHGCFVGSGAVVVLSDRDDLPAAALNLIEFFRAESCGQCTPCRAGTAKLAAMMGRAVWDRAAMTELSQAMRDASICGLGQAAANPVLSLLRHFPAAVPGAA